MFWLAGAARKSESDSKKNWNSFSEALPFPFWIKLLFGILPEQRWRGGGGGTQIQTHHNYQRITDYQSVWEMFQRRKGTSGKITVSTSKTFLVNFTLISFWN
jgi:hypothetical protein